MEERHLEFYEIVKGHWSSAGNFIAESTDGSTIHVYAKQMETLGYASILEEQQSLTPVVNFPFFMLAYNKQFINAAGVNAIRLTAASVWDSYDKLIKALLVELRLSSLK
jgi:hypothetical protein